MSSSNPQLNTEEVDSKTSFETHPDCFDGVAMALQECWAGVIVGIGFVSLLAYVGLTYFLFTGSIFSLVLLGMGFLVFPFVGAVVAAFWSIFAIAFVLALNWTFWEFLDRRTAVAIMGGATGMFSTCWPIFNYQTLGPVVGIVSAMIIWLAVGAGQIGGLYWARKRDSFFSPTEISPETGKVYSPEVIAKPDALQFKITHIFIGMIWLSILFSLDQFVAQHKILLFATVYLVFQSFWLAFDWILRRFIRHRSSTRIAT